jgi:hypothetical protein
MTRCAACVWWELAAAAIVSWDLVLVQVLPGLCMALLGILHCAGPSHGCSSCPRQAWLAAYCWAGRRSHIAAQQQAAAFFVAPPSCSTVAVPLSCGVVVWVSQCRFACVAQRDMYNVLLLSYSQRIVNLSCTAFTSSSWALLVKGPRVSAGAVLSDTHLQWTGWSTRDAACCHSLLPPGRQAACVLHHCITKRQLGCYASTLNTTRLHHYVRRRCKMHVTTDQLQWLPCTTHTDETLPVRTWSRFELMTPRLRGTAWVRVTATDM